MINADISIIQQDVDSGEDMEDGTPVTITGGAGRIADYLNTLIGDRREALQDAQGTEFLAEDPDLVITVPRKFTAADINMLFTHYKSIWNDYNVDREAYGGPPMPYRLQVFNDYVGEWYSKYYICIHLYK